jgi:hypothetical protein
LLVIGLRPPKVIHMIRLELSTTLSTAYPQPIITIGQNCPMAP